MPSKDPWLSPRARRRLLITLYAVGVGVAASLAAILGGAIAFRDDFSLSDRLSAINDVFAGAALVLALIGGIVALQSYASATGSPDIRVQVWFGSDTVNDLAIVVDVGSDGSMRSVNVAGQASLSIRLRNGGLYDASDVVVSVYFRDFYFDQALDSIINGWRVIDAVDGKGALAAESSALPMLHASTTRRLPVLDLISIARPPGLPPGEMVLRVASARYYRELTIPVRFLRSDSSSPSPPSSLPEWL